MHTFEGKTCRINHHEDFSGDAIISVEAERGSRNVVEVAAEDLLAFAAEYVRSRKIAALENATTEELL